MRQGAFEWSHTDDTQETDMTTVNMTARYPGVCSATGASIRQGDAISYDRRTRKAILRARGETIVVGHDDSKYISNYVRFSSGAEIYRNKRGLCEDAPCCGCCNG